MLWDLIIIPSAGLESKMQLSFLLDVGMMWKPPVRCETEEIKHLVTRRNKRSDKWKPWRYQSGSLLLGFWHALLFMSHTWNGTWIPNRLWEQQKELLKAGGTNWAIKHWPQSSRSFMESCLTQEAQEPASIFLNLHSSLKVRPAQCTIDKFFYKLWCSLLMILFLGVLEQMHFSSFRRAIRNCIMIWACGFGWNSVWKCSTRGKMQ